MDKPATKVSKVDVTGPLAPYSDALRARLVQLGYTPLTSVNALRLVKHLSIWLQQRSLGAADLTPDRVLEYVEARRAGLSHAWTPQSLVPLLDLLREEEVVPPATHAAPQPGSIDELLHSFGNHLRKERGLAGTTTDAYVLRARRFVGGLDGRDLAEVTAGDVTRAVRAEAEARSIGSVQYFVVALRAFLRYCFLEGLIGADLSAAALGATGRRHSDLPRGIPQGHAWRIVAACDRRRSQGRRDYAVLLILVRLGLRASEVAALRLEDIDWRAGELVVHGKARREDRLPLPTDVGEAIAGYLQRGRPQSAHREVFLRALAPIRPLGRGGVSCIVRTACRRAGVAAVGAHRLRHSLACEMVGAGIPLSEIGQVLRHQSTLSTANYARVNVEGLRQLAQPWPGGGGR